MSTHPPILEIRQLVKQYKNLKAVDGISFTIRQGSCFGLLGPNGAGKTTAMEVIEDILDPTAGEILYYGAARSASFREEIGIQFQHTTLLNFLSVGETLETFQKLYRRVEALDTLIETCHLREILPQRNDAISGGQAQRLLLALALVNKPKLLFLDEPSTGLDPQARRNLWEIIQQVKNDGKTIILTTHSMEEAEYLCDEVAIMDQGRIIAQGSPPDLIARHCRGGTVTLPQSAIGINLAHLPFPYHIIHDHIEIQAANIHATLETLLAMKIDVADMKVHSPNLEDVFLNLTGKHLRD